MKSVFWAQYYFVHCSHSFKTTKYNSFGPGPAEPAEWWDNLGTGIVIDEEWKENVGIFKASLISSSELLHPYIEAKSMVTRSPRDQYTSVRIRVISNEKCPCLLYNLSDSYCSSLPFFIKEFSNGGDRAVVRLVSVSKPNGN